MKSARCMQAPADVLPTARLRLVTQRARLRTLANPQKRRPTRSQPRLATH